MTSTKGKQCGARAARKEGMMDYDAMEAGPELDCEIARKVMGWREREEKTFGITWFWHKSAQALENEPNWYASGRFSTDIGTAWKVLEKIENITYGASGDVQNMAVSFPHFERDRGAIPLWRCYVAGYDAKGNDYWIEAFAPTAPLAICRAALKAVEARTDVG